MRPLLSLLLSCFLFGSVGIAAQTPDPVLLNGLKAWLANGSDAGLHVWYADNPELSFTMKEKVRTVVRDMGSVFDTEVIAIQTISKRVTRYYVAVYYDSGPLWLRIERYLSDKQASYLPVRFSTDPDRILPGYITEFQQ
jgi:hypothetical protein